MSSCTDCKCCLIRSYVTLFAFLIFLSNVKTPVQCHWSAPTISCFTNFNFATNIRDFLHNPFYLAANVASRGFVLLELRCFKFNRLSFLLNHFLHRIKWGLDLTYFTGIITLTVWLYLHWWHLLFLILFQYLVVHPSRRLHNIPVTGYILLESVWALQVQVTLNEKEDAYLIAQQCQRG